MPAAEAGWLEEPVMVSALSGVSGAGRSPALKTSFVELEGGASIYKAGSSHQHVPEMERNLGRLTGAPIAHAAPSLSLALAVPWSMLLEIPVLQTRGLDPLVFAGVALVVLLVALMACLPPLRRALRIDPAQALRSE